MRKLILTLLVGFCLISCTSGEDAPNVFGGLHGMVVEESTGAAVHNVTITLSPVGNTTVTGTDGRYEFINLESKQYTITAYKAGYQPDVKQITVLPDQTVIGDFMLRKGSSSLLANPDILDFGSSKSTMVFDLRNESSVATEFSVVEPVGGWCRVSPASGTLQASTGTVGITVTIDRSEISSNKIDNILITADNGGSESVEVRVSTDGGGGTTPSGTQVTAGLWAYYTFDDETMNDSWENQMNGNFDYIPKFTTITPNGEGKSMMVGLNNNNQWVKARIPYNPFKSKTEYSYSFWVKNPTQGLLMNAYGSGSDPDNSSGNYPVIRIADNKLYACFASYSIDDYFDYNPQTTLQNGSWNHIAVSVKDREQILYINGVRTSTQQQSVYGSNSTEIHFGGSLYRYDGAEMALDNIRIYTRSISADDAQNIYNSEK